MAKIWGFVGCGNLAQSIIEGAVNLGALEPNQVIASDLDFSKLQEFTERLKISAAVNVDELLSAADVIVLAAKPQDISIILEKLANSAKTQAVVSLAAGVSDKLLLKYLSKFSSVARVMANTPALVQRGFFGIYFAKKNPLFETEIVGVFKKLGEVALLKNNQQVDALTSASASGVGFVLSFMEEYEKWLIKKGFSLPESRRMAVEIFLGTAQLAKVRNHLSLGELREAVSSKKGTTLAGLAAMKKAKVAAGLKAGLDAGLRRAVEISKELLRGKK